MQKILLIGFRGSGKTTLGRSLALKLGLPFIDADEEIEKKEGLTIKEMVEKKGWSYFRKLERDFLRGLLERENLVCALGGGAILHEEEMERLKKESVIIWVDASIAEIKERLKEDKKGHSQRPALTNLAWEEEIEKIYKERTPLYQKWAHLRVDTTSKSPGVLIKEMVNYLKDFFLRKEI